MRRRKDVKRMGRKSRRERIREACMKRIRKSREKILERCRKGIGRKAALRDVIRNELERVEPMSEDEEEEVEKEEEDREIDFLMMLERDLYNDLREQEAKFIEELERTELEQLNLDVLEFTSSAGDKADSEDYVLCPLCCKHSLDMKGSTVLCRCGLRLDIGNDGLTLVDLKRNLASVFDDHLKRGCDLKQPTFELQRRFGNSILVAKCDDCEWLSVVL